MLYFEKENMLLIVLDIRIEEYWSCSSAFKNWTKGEVPADENKNESNIFLSGWLPRKLQLSPKSDLFMTALVILARAEIEG